MCRSNVTPPARAALAAVLADIRNALAADTGIDPQLIKVGPVDFGDETSERQEIDT